MLSAEDAAFVNSAVIFGDPNNGKPVGKVSAANTMVICHTGDLICAGQAVILTPHLTYGADAGDAATFVVGNMKAPAAAAGAAGAAGTAAGAKGAAGAGLAGAASAARVAAKGATAKGATAKGAARKAATRAVHFAS